jgi:hypothetical protein
MFNRVRLDDNDNDDDDGKMGNNGDKASTRIFRCETSIQDWTETTMMARRRVIWFFCGQ